MFTLNNFLWTACCRRLVPCYVVVKRIGPGLVGFSGVTYDQQSVIVSA